MSWFFANKVVRFLLAFIVSIWMAGGCLIGCSKGTMAADLVDDSVPTIDAGESCHAMQSHHCCDAAKPRKQAVRKLRQPTGLLTFAPSPRDLMKDCPLAVNATAAASKNGAHGAAPERVPVAALPSLEKQTITTDNNSVVSFLPNRGPTHLRCCVFLI